MKIPERPAILAPKKSVLSRYKMALALSAVLAVAAVSGTIFYNDSKVAQANAVTLAATPVATPPAAPPKKDDIMDLTASINVILQKSSLDISVSVINLNTSAKYNFGDDASYVGASEGKLVTASLLLHQVQQGNIKLSDSLADKTIQQQLQKMIEVSDNDAWTALNDLLGHTNLQAYGAKLGLASYSADNNEISSADTALLLQKLYKGQLLNTHNTQLLLSYLQVADQKQYIVAGSPEDARVYHKTGYLDDRLHDAAIVDDGHTPYILVIFSKTTDGSAYDFSAAETLFGAITAAVNTQLTY